MRIIKSSEITRYLYCPRSLNFNDVKKEQVYEKKDSNLILILIIIGAICLLLLLRLL